MKTKTLVWQAVERFPKATGDWQIYKSGAINQSGESAVRSLARRWYPAQATLVATPTSDRFLPAICAPGLEAFTHENFLRRYRIIFYLVGLYFALVIGIIALTNDPIRYGAVLVFLLVAFLYLLAEYRYVFLIYPILKDRALFLHWLFSQHNRPLYVFAGIAVLAGILQLIYVLFLGDLDTLVIVAGTYFPRVESGQWWRYFSGPLIHSSVIHWLVNFSLLFLLIRMIGRLSNVALLFLIALSLPLSAMAVHLFNPPGSIDGFVGISGAVFCLFGWLGGLAIRERSFFPAHFALSVLLLAGVNLLLPELLGYNASFIAHITGLVIGLISGASGFASHLSDTQTQPSRG